MATFDISITNDDAESSITLKTLTHNVGEGNVEPGTDVIVLEPGAGTSITVADLTVLVVRENSISDLPVPTAVAHIAGETETTIETPVP